MKALAVSSITFSYAGASQRALDDFSISVEEGRIHAILGPNGAGKSTLMKIIFGLYQPDAGGEILINGEKP